MSVIYNKQIRKRKSSFPLLSLCKTDADYPLQRKRSKSLISSILQLKDKKSLQQKCNYQLSIEHISFLLQQQKLKQLENINKNICLKKYYETFKSLFMILYKTSRMVLTYLYYNKNQDLNFNRLQIINALLNNFSTEWDEQIIIKIQTISKNIYELCHDGTQFQKRIQYVARKICHNKQKSQQIKNSVMNNTLKKYWHYLNKRISLTQNFQFLNQMLIWSPQRLCFYDVQQYIKFKLSKISYKQQIQKYCKKYQIDDDMDINYSFQFLMIQEFTLNLNSIEMFVDQQDQIQNSNVNKIINKDDKCRIM